MSEKDKARSTTLMAAELPSSCCLCAPPQFLHNALELGRTGQAANTGHPLPDDWPWPPSAEAPALAKRLTSGLRAFVDCSRTCAVALAVLNPVCSRLARDEKPLGRDTVSAAAAALERHDDTEGVQLNGMQLFLLATAPTVPDTTRAANRALIVEARGAALASAALSEFSDNPVVAGVAAGALRRVLSFSGRDREKVRLAALEAGALEAARRVAKIHKCGGVAARCRPAMWHRSKEGRGD